jgi:hypothetical protein
VPALVARCVRLVIPVVSRQFQRNLAAALLTAEYVLAELEGRPTGEVREATAEVLAGVPEAAEWATRHLESRVRPCSVGYEWEAPLAVAGAIRAVVDFRVPAGDGLLRQLLVEAVEECRAWMSPSAEPTRTRLPTAVASR